jgi:hypothetical protein
MKHPSRSGVRRREQEKKLAKRSSTLRAAITVLGKPGRLQRLAILPGTARKPQLIFRTPEVAIDPLLKLNGDQAPPPQAEQHSHEIGEQLLGLVGALRWRYRSGVLDGGPCAGEAAAVASVYAAPLRIWATVSRPPAISASAQCRTAE